MAAKSAEELSRERSVSKATLYNWRKKYGGMEASEMKRIKELEEENARLKLMYANLAMEFDVAKYTHEQVFLRIFYFTLLRKMEKPNNCQVIF